MLPTSKSRPIEFDGIAYRWAVVCAGDTGHALVVEAQGRAGIAIQLVCEVSGMYWLCDGEHSYVGAVTPNWVRLVWRQACAAGWKPTTSTGRAWFKVGVKGIART